MNKQQIVILVGPDRTGKTHIAAELNKRIPNSFVYKASNEHDSFLNHQDRFINHLRWGCPARLDMIKQSRHLGVSVIFDRAYPCEIVYSAFYHRVTDVTIIKYLDEEYSKLDARIVFCTRKSFVGIQDDLDARLDSTALANISSMYEGFLQWTLCKHLKVFVDDENLEREASEIMGFLGENK